jgi:cleavage and polyadenylation specificity factor subunit 3
MQGTLAAELLTNPREVLASDGRVLKVRASISAFSFSAHADYSQTSSFVESLAPSNVVLCHGNQIEMERLRKALVKQAATAKANREIHTPKVPPLLVLVSV